MFNRFIHGWLLCLAIAAIVAPPFAGPLPKAFAQGPHTEEIAAAEKSSGINPIPMSWDQVKGDLTIWTAVVFLVVMLILWKFAWGPLSEGLDKRERHIADQIFQANEANQKA
ncbi:MAG: ATP synthase F0 subunit B, partial [Thermoguttaceae bacterium]